VEAEGFRGEPMLPGRGKLGTGQKRESIRERERKSIRHSEGMYY